MKYKVLHSVLQYDGKDGPCQFKRDQVVKGSDLSPHWSIDWLLKNEAVEPLEGTEDVGEADPDTVNGVAEDAGPNVRSRRGVAGKS